MHHLTAIFGAVFIFVTVFFLSTIAVSMGPDWLRTSVTLGPLWTNNPFGVLFAVGAATLSYRATIRHYVQKRQSKQQQVEQQEQS